MGRIFLVRHGETAWNNEGRAQGQSDTPLSDEGRRQAEMLSSRLESVQFSLAYSSDLKRASDTASILLKGRDTPLDLVQDIREKRYGEWEGKTFKEIQEWQPELYSKLFEENTQFAPPGGESDSDVYKRVQPFCARVKSHHTQDENVMVVGHGGAMRAMLVNLLDLPVDALWRFRLANTSVSIVSCYPGGNATLDLLNDTTHLEPNFG